MLLEWQECSALLGGANGVTARAAGTLRRQYAIVMSSRTDVTRLSHLPLERNPVTLEHAADRAQSVQNRIADKITAFAGSMSFVYIPSSGSVSGSALALRTIPTAC